MIKLERKFEVGARDDAWLEQFTEEVWHSYFYDVARKLPLVVKFGRRARSRLGSLSLDSKHNRAVLRVTGLFKEPDIPEMIIKATVVHELCHYAHGFHSGLERKHKHPHAGGVIRREFAERGLEDLYIKQKKWLNTNWLKVVKKHKLLPKKQHIRYRFKII